MARSFDSLVRVRQRSRTSLRAFRANLQPMFCEIGLDRLQVSVSGEWRGNFADYRELLRTYNPNVDWFRSWADRRNRLVLRSRSDNRSTLGKIELTVNGSNPSSDWINARLTCNPTRTLASLLSAHWASTDLQNDISLLDPFDFFTRSGDLPPRALDGGANYVEDYDAARNIFGQDIFSEFLPIFVRQLQTLVMRMIAPRIGSRVTARDTDLIVGDSDLHAIMRWGEASVPQAEAYFERHHSSAVLATQTAARKAVMSLDSVDVTRHFSLASVFASRRSDCLSFEAQLPNKKRLAVYAKLADRLRFEIRRKGTGRYIGIAQPISPSDRLVNILNFERENLLRACRWSAVGPLFEEPSEPHPNDFVELTSLIYRACAPDYEAFQPVLRRLLGDQGLTAASVEMIAGDVVTRLEQHGVIERIRLRQRDVGNTERRMVLASRWTGLIDRLNPHVPPDNDED